MNNAGTLEVCELCKPLNGWGHTDICPTLRAKPLTFSATVEASEVTRLELDPDEPVPFWPVSLQEELAASHKDRDSDRKAAATYIRGIEDELAMAKENLAAALRFILGDKARAAAWATRGGK
jgi:hypothetical protein